MDVAAQFRLYFSGGKFVICALVEKTLNISSTIQLILIKIFTKMITLCLTIFHTSQMTLTI